MIRAIILSCLLFLCGTPVWAYTEIVDILLDGGQETLGRGGLRKITDERESLDFVAPLSLDTKGDYRLETGYEHQRTVRVYDGRWSGSHGYAEKLETAAATPYSLLDGKVSGAVAVGYGYRWFDIVAKSPEDEVDVRSEEHFEAKKGGIFLQGFDRFRVGVSLVDSDYRSGLEIPIEAEVKPFDFIRLGYKRSYIDVAADFAVLLEGTRGTVPLRYGEEVHELYVKGEYRDLLYGMYSQELNGRGNYRLEGKIELPGPWYAVGTYRRRNLSFDQNFYVGAEEGGYAKGDISLLEYRMGIGANPSKTWNLEANYQRRRLTVAGGGMAFTSAVAGFWPSLVVGDYNHLFNGAVNADQYHAGVTYKGESVSVAFGLQYIYLKTAANLDYWRNVLFGLGKTDFDSLNLDTDRVKLLFLSLGLGYQWKNVSIQYAFGQFIPIGTREKNDEPDTDGAGGGGGGDDESIFSKIADKINHNPGGNIQRILLTISF